MINTFQRKVWLVRVTAALTVPSATGSTLTGCDEHQTVADETTDSSGSSSSSATTIPTNTDATETSAENPTGSGESTADTVNATSNIATDTTTQRYDSTTHLDAGVTGDASPSPDTNMTDASVHDAASVTAVTDAFVESGSATALLEQARADYRGWEPRTAQPVNISVEIFALCRIPSAAESAFVESVHGDELALQDWLNAEARAGISAVDSNTSANDAGVTFAVGATIVKEKLVRKDSGLALAALGLMLKREPGFDPTTGDWQFGYWEPELGMLSGSEAQTSCGECHALAGTDYVYVDDSWRLPQRP